jgi:hypothetical protein
MNQRVLKTRKRSSTLKHTILGVSGGISYDAHEAMGAEKIKLADHQFDDADKLRPVAGENHWWWD